MVPAWLPEGLPSYPYPSFPTESQERQTGGAAVSLTEQQKRDTSLLLEKLPIVSEPDLASFLQKVGPQKSPRE